jgi:hypothetical protein
MGASMMTAFQTIGLSVFSSILAVVLAFGVRMLWNKWVEDYWLRVVNRNVPDIRGAWKAEYQDLHGNSCTESIQLHQFGWRVRGEIHYRLVPKAQSPKIDKVFAFEGFIRNDLVVGNYWNQDRRQKGAGAFTLALRSAGDTLAGESAWFDVEADKIVSAPYQWTRSRL